MKKRVVITGMGAVTSIGIGTNNFWKAIKEGKCGIDKVERIDCSKLSSKIAGEIKNFDPVNYIEKKEARRMDRFTQFAITATKMAIEDAEINLDLINKERLGVIIGSGIGGLETLENQHSILQEKGPDRVSPFFIPMMIANMAAGQISILLNAKGINETIVTACASGTNAIGDAFKCIQRGSADIIVTGGVEAPITPLAFAGFCSMKALSRRNDEPQTASRPFDAQRDGFVMSEGAGIIVLEEYEHAIKRDAEIIAEVIGYGATADAYHITAPAPEGEGGARAMLEAINDANLMPNQIDYINAHGTSTPLNDKFETQAIKTVFGSYANHIKISSTKSMTGHMLGAAGGIEVIICACALKEGFIPATINYTNPDPECDLNYVPNNGIKKDINYALSNSFGFGGHNATVIIKKYQ